MMAATFSHDHSPSPTVPGGASAAPRVCARLPLRAYPARPGLGFTLIELLVTLALVGVAAMVVLPMASLMETRAKEAELRVALRTLRKAIDDYKTAADAGMINKPTGTSGYPASLDVLVSGVPRSNVFGFSATPMVFLRSIPRDPFDPDKTTPAVQTWNLRRYGAQPGDFSAGADVFDVSSRSDRNALDGSRLSDW